jgi:hypothetical protein
MGVEHWLEHVWEELRAELVKLFGDNNGVHASVDDAKKKALDAEMANQLGNIEADTSKKAAPLEEVQVVPAAPEVQQSSQVIAEQAKATNDGQATT